MSELATNAVLHARSDFEVTVIRYDQRVRVEVFDQNTRMPSFAVALPDAYSGRGLMLERELASVWGVESHSDSGKTIWFELELSAPSVMNRTERPRGVPGYACRRQNAQRNGLFCLDRRSHPK